MGPSRKYYSPKKKTDTPTNVSRADIEKKLSELNDAIEETTSSAASMAKVAVVVGVAVVIVLAFVSGRRRALRTKTIVSFIKTR